MNNNENTPKNLTFVEYTNLAKRTDLSESQYTIASERLIQNIRLLHALIGLQTELGEILDTVKKHIYYGKEIDEEAIINLAEEAGDLNWYMAILMDEISILTQGKFTPENIPSKNIDKLKIRYPDKFSNENALNRNIMKELKQIEEQDI